MTHAATAALLVAVPLFAGCVNLADVSVVMVDSTVATKLGGTGCPEFSTNVKCETYSAGEIKNAK